MRIFNYGMHQSKVPEDLYDEDLHFKCTEIVKYIFGMDNLEFASPNDCFEIYKYVVNNMH